MIYLMRINLLPEKITKVILIISCLLLASCAGKGIIKGESAGKAFARNLINEAGIKEPVSEEVVITGAEDIEIFYNTMDYALKNSLISKPVNEIFTEICKGFIGTKYEAGTLEMPKREMIVFHLTGMDCVTFVEYSLAFTRCIKSNRTALEDFIGELRLIRYRNGILEDYPSRLHYFTDWIYDGENKKILKNMSFNFGGETYDKNIFYMSANSNSYSQLRDNPEWLAGIRGVESAIASRQDTSPPGYIKKDKINLIENKILDGDIIAITTDIEGLDISHTGIAVRDQEGRLHLLHAPAIGRRVEISKAVLTDIISVNKHYTGIIVARIL